ncbi:MAG TPA: YcaO-like family protein [Thermoleophilaceae bacterium]|nr:YcaO-like family protein [Thermoleophilaceae bacterium]
MQITAGTLERDLRTDTKRLLDRLTNPLCGLDQGIGFILRGRADPRFVVAGGQLTGVHLLLNRREPGSYHIGGGGITTDEAMIKTLAESIERYCQLVAARTGAHTIRMATRDEMLAEGERVLEPERLRLFAADQYESEGFLFQPFALDEPLGWVEMRSAVDEGRLWVPAQLAFVGYVLGNGERALAPGVTTGTAAHTSPTLARRNALLELVQIDAVMGHWYTDAVAPEVILDTRCAPVERLIEKLFRRAAAVPSFYWLESPDLPTAVIACVMRKRNAGLPAISVGMGSDFDVARAIYKALAEAIGVMHLAKVGLVNEALQRTRTEDPDPAQIFDLDSNVTYHAEHGEYIDRKFGRTDPRPASELPHEPGLAADEEVKTIIEAFRDGGKDVLELDLTTDDVRDLGFRVARMWSPDTLALSLPSAPPVCHPRFDDYGGASHRHPHPYP